MSVKVGCWRANRPRGCMWRRAVTLHTPSRPPTGLYWRISTNRGCQLAPVRPFAATQEAKRIPTSENQLRSGYSNKTDYASPGSLKSHSNTYISSMISPARPTLTPSSTFIFSNEPGTSQTKTVFGVYSATISRNRYNLSARHYLLLGSSASKAHFGAKP